MGIRETFAFYRNTLSEDGLPAMRFSGALVLVTAIVTVLVAASHAVGSMVAGPLGISPVAGAAGGRALAFLGLMLLAQAFMVTRLARLERRIRGIASDKGLDRETTDDLLSAASNGTFAGGGFVLFLVFLVLTLASLKAAGL